MWLVHVARPIPTQAPILESEGTLVLYREASLDMQARPLVLHVLNRSKLKMPTNDKLNPGFEPETI